MNTVLIMRNGIKFNDTTLQNSGARFDIRPAMREYFVLRTT